MFEPKQTIHTNQPSSSSAEHPPSAIQPPSAVQPQVSTLPGQNFGANQQAIVNPVPPLLQESQKTDPPST